MLRLVEIMVIVMTGAYSGVMILAEGHWFTRPLDTSHDVMTEKKAEQSPSTGMPEFRIDSPVSLVD
jgi:hypothetical protein